MPHGRRHGKPAGTARRVHDRGGAAGGLWGALVLDRATNIDEVVGKHPKSDPAFEADIAAISAAVETMPPLGDADALADDFRCGLEQADNLAFCAGIAAIDARPGLLHYLPDPRHHLVDVLAQR